MEYCFNKIPPIKYELIIFDQDDTLFDYHKTEYNAIETALIRLGITPPADFWSFYKKSNDIAKNTVPNYILNLNDFRLERAKLFFKMINESTELVQNFISLYLSESEHGILFPDVYKTLSQIRIPMVIGTNGSTYPRYDRLKNSSIFSFIKKFYSSELLGVSKPNPEFFHLICNDQKVNPQKCLVVGDRVTTDIVGAYNAGIHSCLITNGKTDDPSNFSSFTISKITELFGVIS